MKSFLKKILPNYILTKYREIRFFIEYLNFKTNIQKLRKNNKKIFIIVGAGPTKYKGWLSTNYPWFDLLKLETFKKYFKSREVEKILAEHVFEHLTEDEAIRSAKFIYEHLLPQGSLRIAVPDGNHPDPDYRKHCGIGGIGADASDHKQFITMEKLVDILENAGFKVEPQEGYRSDGSLLRKNIDEGKGFIQRSRSNAQMNSNESVGWVFPDSNTSLIVDGYKT